MSMSSDCLYNLDGASSYRLFPRSGFLTGIARLLDWSGSLNRVNASRSPAEADRCALASDWAVVGQDMRGAMVRVWGDLDEEQRRAIHRSYVALLLQDRGFDEVEVGAVLRELDGRSLQRESVS